MPVRKGAAAAAPAQEYVNFGLSSFYSGGGGLPNGYYVFYFQNRMFQPANAQGVTRGPVRLGVMVTAYSLTDEAAEPKEQFYSMGSNADKSFAPDSDTGKHLVAVPGGPSTTLNNQTNWAYLRKSMIDCGMPEDAIGNDLENIDGMWVHVTNVPEPEERKTFAASKTAEVQEERKAGTIGIISEILDGGKPWEGTGGVPAAGQFPVLGPAGTAPAPAARVPAAPARPVAAPRAVAPAPAAPAAPRAPGRAPAPAPRAVAAPVAAPPEQEISAEDLATAALNAVAGVLAKNPNGVGQLVLRTSAFGMAKSQVGDEMAQAVIDTYFASDDNLNIILGQLGYSIQGQNVKPIAQ